MPIGFRRAAKLQVDEHPEEIAPDVFGYTGVFAGSLTGLPTRMTVMRLAGTQDLVVYAPFEPGDVDLSELGTVKAVIAPNRRHHAFAQRFLAGHPEATLYSSPALAERFPERDWGRVLDEAAGEDVISQEVLVKTMTGFDYLKEVVALHVASGTVLVGDLAYNVTPRVARRMPGVGRALQRVAGARRGLDVPWVVKWWIRPDCSKGLGQLRAVAEEWEWDRMVPCHGDVVQRGAKEAFRRGTLQNVSEKVSGRT